MSEIDSDSSVQHVFEDLYASGDWTLVDGEQNAMSLSGLGSNILQTTALRRELPNMFSRYAVSTLLDLPCGDFFWMNRVDLRGINYIGGDIARGVVGRNQAEHGTPGARQFCVLDIMKDDLPPADMLFSRDCLVHLDDSSALSALANIARSEIEYVAITTFVSRKANRDIRTGEWRPMNLQLPPFSLPDPLEILDEECSEAYEVSASDGGTKLLTFEDKSIGVWHISALRERFPRK